MVNPWLRAYALAGRCATPPLALYLQWRVRQGKEDPARVGERWGRDERSRPPGSLVWIHAASVGESLSVLPVIGALLTADASLHVLLTTVTRTAADLLAERLPPRALHAYTPFDTAPAWRRFLARWRPNVTVVVEQELWPMMLALAPPPRLLLNARLSARTLDRWRRFPAVGRWLVQRFDRILAMSTADAERLRALGARSVETPGNLKEAAAPLPVDATTLAAWTHALAGRPVWVAASTHPPEERWIDAADGVLRATRPRLLTIVVPRHAERGATIAAELSRDDLLLRSRDRRVPDARVGLVVADTLGELGLFYRLAAVTVVGGSFIPHGGQNPLEPARLGRPVLFGPHMSNFAEAAARLEAAGAARRTTTVDLAGDVARWLDDPTARACAAAAAVEVTARASDALPRAVAAIRAALAQN